MSFYKLNESPEANANCLSRLFYWWLNSLFRLGYTRDLEIDDLHRVLPQDESSNLGELLEKEWTEELRCRHNNILIHKSKLNFQKKPKLLNVILRVFGRRFLLIGLIKFFEECFVKMAQPLCLALLIRYFYGELDRSTGVLSGGAIILGSCFNVMTMHPYFHGVERIGMQIRIACSSLLYRKAFRLSHTSLRKTTVGQMVNLLNNDVTRFDNIQNIHYVWIGIIQVSITTYILWGYFGPYCLCGLSVLFLFVPFQGSMGRFLSKLRLLTAIQTDGRLRIINEILNGMRVIKMYAWEIPFSNLVNDARGNEMKVLRKTSTFRAINWSLSFTSTQVTIFITLLVYVLGGNILTSEKVFVCLALYSCIRITLGLHFPLGIYELGEFWVSTKRIQDFLLLEELNKFSNQATQNIPCIKINLIPEIIVTNLYAKWDESDSEQVLSNINFKVQPSQLFAIVGPVGGGKSSLLMALLRELPSYKGEINITGDIAYVAQESWIFAGSIRENIVFGKDYSSIWYEKVLDACALRQDLSILPNGDSTVVGDKGINLSGGQKARVSLARAVYANADIYLLDDPLSAVDAEVANHIFQNCICGILNRKIIVLVTHQVQFLNLANAVLCMEKGKVVAQGAPLELMAKGLDFNLVFKENLLDSNYVSIKSNMNASTRATPTDQMSGYCEEESETVSVVGEDKLSGVVNLQVYRGYFRAGSTIFSFSALVLFNIATQFSQSGSEYWLQYWTNSMELSILNNRNVTVIEAVPDNNFEYMLQTDLSTQVYVYTVIIISLFVFSLLRTSLFFRICLNAGRNLHNKMFYSVLRAPMQFFEINSSGRILNRFSKDTDLMDDALPPTFFVSIEVLLRGFGSVVLIGIIAPYILLPAIVLTFFLLVVRRIYVRTARSIKRLEANARSPLLSHLSSSFYGIKTIRAFHMEKLLIEQFHAHQDIHSTIFYLNIVTNRWIGMWLDWISVGFVTSVIMILIYASNVDGSEAGLAVSSAMILTGVFQWGVRQSAAVETQMISIERIFKYIGISSEAQLNSVADKKPPPNWPNAGVINFDDVELEYGPDSKVLKNVTIAVRPEEKVGIIGRTGAGKSSLISVLFRLVEPSGKVEIDGIDILKIGLHDLRSKITIIPQDPVLFQGTLRKNLDPFGKHTDHDLWKSVQDVSLMEHVESTSLGLEMKIHEGGNNLSVGQRQLVCLARAILRKNKILVLDEATANVDLETDGLVQRKVRELFKHCTVLTVAHRLSTVIDCDRILVLDQGRVKEFDTPAHLLQNPHSALSQMVEQTGEKSSCSLRNLAEQKHLTQ